MSRLFIVPWPAAGTRGRHGSARAPRHTSATRWLTSTLPAPTAAGGNAATKDPGGATTVTGRIAPPLAGMVGSTAERSEYDTADTVTASTAFTLPRACGSVPVKSKDTESPEIVSATTTRAGCCWSAAAPVEADGIGAHLGIEVADPLGRRAGVGREQLPDRLAEQQRRQPQPLLVDV